MRSQTAIFRMRVRDFISNELPLAVPPDITLADLVERMRTQRASSATVIDGSGRPVGIVTEQDITRRVAYAMPPETPVSEVMAEPVLTIPSGEYLYHAIARMRRFGLRHMPVVDAGGALSGMLNLHDALAVAASRLMDQIDRLTHEGTQADLKEVKAAQVALAAELFDDNLPAPEVGELLTRINNDIYRRIVDAALRDLAGGGWGEPPVRFSAIVMGSGGRGENYLFPDQDNGFILEDYPDAEHNRVDSFFIKLAEQVTHDLDAVGFPYCNGYCMAVNPLWRKTEPQWIDQIGLWLRKRNFVAIRLSGIFFDFQPVWGDTAAATRVRRKVLEMVSASPFFLQEIYSEAADHNVALGLFGRFITERDKDEYLGHINLKHTGTIPLVESIRLLALRSAIEETSTLRRMDELHAKGVLDTDEREDLQGAFRHITGILLRQQIKDFQAGNRVGYYVNPETLSNRARALLVDSFRAIDGLRKKVRAEFTGDVF